MVSGVFSCLGHTCNLLWRNGLGLIYQTILLFLGKRFDKLLFILIIYDMGNRTTQVNESGQLGHSSSVVLFPQAHLAGKAHYIVRRTIVAGLLIRPSQCSACNTLCYPDGHHADYTKPLEVEWLCNSCHKKVHAGSQALDRQRRKEYMRMICR